jgi:hypothetical protein
MTDLGEDPKAMLQARLEAARERKTAAEPSAAERELADLQASVEAAELAARDAEAVKAAVAKHGKLDEKIGVVYTRLGCIVVTRPHTASFRMFQDLEEPKGSDVEDLVMPCVVHPSRKDADKMLEELPGTLAQLADKVALLAGVKRSKLAGK